MKKYFPTFLSKAGEFKALANLDQNVKNEIIPILQVLPSNFEKTETELINNWSFNNNGVFLDFSYSEDELIELKRNLILNLLVSNVNVIPVLHNDSSKNYIQFIREAIDTGRINKIAIRFKSDNNGFVDLNSVIDYFLSTININRADLSIILDFGYIQDSDYKIVSKLAVDTIQNLSMIEVYENIIIASSSFLSNLGILTPAGKLHTLRRYEWDIWLFVKKNIKYSNIRYSDYGTKHPIYAEVKYAGSCSIKYTIEKEYVIYRGEKSENHPEGNGQYIIFAERLINSEYYPGVEFSWGDGQIEFYANQNIRDTRKKTGNAETWVAISQNHHITLLHSLL